MGGQSQESNRTQDPSKSFCITKIIVCLKHIKFEV